MTRPTSLFWTLLVCAAADAAEPPAAQTTAPASASTITSAKPATTAGPESRPPLDLRIGDIRKYMTPKEFQAAVSRSAELQTVLVEADRPMLPLNTEKSVARRIFSLFAPVMREPLPREPADKIPPLIFRYT